MKLNCLKSAAVATACSLALLASAEATVVVGTGTSSSFLVIEAAEFGAPLELEFRYTFNPGSPLDTYAMLTAVDLALPNLSFTFQAFGEGGPPSYFLTAITFNSISLTNTGAPDFAPFWYQSVSGGKSGYPTAQPIASGVWSEGSGVSSPYRELAPGSWDGLVFGEFGDLPSVSPVPEPAVSTLLGFAVLAVLIHRRRQRA